MANRLTMAKISAIRTLHKSGHSNRKIAELLGVHRETVGRYVRLAESENRTNAPTGSRHHQSMRPPGLDCVQRLRKSGQPPA